MNVEIQNWKTLSNQFGLNDAKKGDKRPYSARQISANLHTQVRALKGAPIVSGLFVPCGEFSELDCAFRLIECINNKYVFSYEGTVG